MEPTQCSETSAFNTQTPGNYPEDNQSDLPTIDKLEATQCQVKEGAFHAVLKFNNNNLSFYYYYF
jgi:hypothetical protein